MLLFRVGAHLPFPLKERKALRTTQRCAIKMRADKLGVPSAVGKLPSSESLQDLGSAFPAQPSLSRTDDGMCPVGHLQLRKDVGDVVAHSVGADEQACGDLGVGVSLGYEVEDLALAGGELGEGLLGRGRFGCGEEVHEAFGDLRSEVGLPTCHGAQHLQDLGGIGTLENVTTGPGAHGGEHRVVVLEHRKNYDPDARVGLEDATGCLYAVYVRHLYVHEDDIRPKLGGSLENFFAGCRLAYDLHVGFWAQHGAQSFSEDGMVVCYEDADGALHDDLAPSGCSSEVGSGRRASTRVPPPGSGSTSHVPPSSSARSRMEESPTPATRFLGIPTPSSLTSSPSMPAPRSTERRMRQVLAWAWRATLVMASWTMR